MRNAVLAALLLFAVSAHAQLESDPAFGLSTDFRNWLTANGYGTSADVRTQDRRSSISP